MQSWGGDEGKGSLLYTDKKQFPAILLKQFRFKMQVRL